MIRECRKVGNILVSWSIRSQQTITVIPKTGRFKSYCARKGMVDLKIKLCTIASVSLIRVVRGDPKQGNF